MQIGLTIRARGKFKFKKLTKRVQKVHASDAAVHALEVTRENVASKVARRMFGAAAAVAVSSGGKGGDDAEKKTNFLCVERDRERRNR